MNKNKNLTLQDAFTLATKNHKENNFKLATELYKQVLEINPNQLHLLIILEYYLKN